MRAYERFRGSRTVDLIVSKKKERKEEEEKSIRSLINIQILASHHQEREKKLCMTSRDDVGSIGRKKGLSEVTTTTTTTNESSIQCG